MSINIDFTSMTFDEIKDSLKTSLRDDGIITDFDYEGSNTDTLLNVMAYVTTLINHNINYMSNEAFLSTARNRKNILKHAQALNYKVERKVSANIKGTLSFYLGGKRQITIPKNTAFSTPDGTTFLTTEDYTFTNSTDVTSLYEKIIVLKEGSIINSTIDSSFSFTFDKNNNSIMTLQYTDIENNGITFYVNKDSSEERIFTETTNIMDDLLNSNDTFIAEYDPETEYVRVRFLTKYGISPNDGDKINVELLISKGTKGNNYKKILPITLYDSSTNVNITETTEIEISFNVNTQDSSYGGADEESNDEIITYAPLAKSTGNRFITALDWNAGLVNMPQISYSNVWGGDELCTDLEMSNFTTYQKESLKQRGTVFMTAVSSSGESFFNVSTIESIKNMLRENSVVSLKKRFMQPIEVGIDLSINAQKDDVVTVTDEYIISQMINITNDYFSNPLNLQFKKSKLINSLYSITGVDSVNLNGTKINLSISGYNFYDDSEDFLDVTLPISRTNKPIDLEKISSSETYLYDFSLVDIPDGITTINKYIYNSTLDNFLDHMGAQIMNYFVWNDQRQYTTNDIIMYPDRETGKIYIARTDTLGDAPSGTTADTDYWKYLPMTSKYMDKYGYPIDFSKYKRIKLVHKEGLEFVPFSGDSSDYYSENQLVWKFNSTTNKIEYFLSKQNNNTSEKLTDEDFWEQIELDPTIVAEDESIIGVYMKEENFIRFPNAQPRKLKLEISAANTFDTQSAFDSTETNGISTYYKRGDVITIAGNDYICRFNVDIPKWSSVAVYNTDDIVYDASGVFWKSKKQNNTSALAEGTSWTAVHTYNSSTTYMENDIVVYSGVCYKCLSTGIISKVPTINRIWKKLVKSINPIVDASHGVWLNYTNTSKYNLDIFSTNINDTTVTNVSSSKRTFYFDTNSGVDELDTENLKFKRELKVIVRNRSINFV